MASLPHATVPGMCRSPPLLDIAVCRPRRPTPTRPPLRSHGHRCVHTPAAAFTLCTPCTPPPTHSTSRPAHHGYTVTQWHPTVRTCTPCTNVPRSPPRQQPRQFRPAQPRLSAPIVIKCHSFTMVSLPPFAHRCPLLVPLSSRSLDCPFPMPHSPTSLPAAPLSLSLRRQLRITGCTAGYSGRRAARFRRRVQTGLVNR